MYSEKSDDIGPALLQESLMRTLPPGFNHLKKDINNAGLSCEYIILCIISKVGTRNTERFKKKKKDMYSWFQAFPTIKVQNSALRAYFPGWEMSHVTWIQNRLVLCLIVSDSFTKESSS